MQEHLQKKISEPLRGPADREQVSRTLQLMDELFREPQGPQASLPGWGGLPGQRHMSAAYRAWLSKNHLAHKAASLEWLQASSSTELGMTVQLGCVPEHPFPREILLEDFLLDFRSSGGWVSARMLLMGPCLHQGQFRASSRLALPLDCPVHPKTSSRALLRHLAATAAKEVSAAAQR